MRGWARFRLIEAPMLRRYLPQAAAAIFMLCVGSFAIVLALGGGPSAATFEVAVFEAIRFEFDPPRAALLALCGLVLNLACLALALQSGIFARSRLYLAAPSKWLIENAKQSMLWPGVVESRVIPNGIDLSVFQPGDRYKTRWRLGLPSDADVLTFAANGLKSNSFKDYETLRRSLELLGQSERERPLVMIALGEPGPTERLGSAEIRRN